MKSGPTEGDKLNALSSLSQELAKTFVSIASDIALVMDADGTIHNVTLGNTPLTTHSDSWVGKSWADTVTADTRGKVERLLHEVSTSGVSRRSEINHISPTGAGIPVSYAAIRLGDAGPVLAVGRDLRAIAAIQQHFVDSQQELERDYWKLRQAESRYRLLFQVATDAVLVLDSLTMRTIEANEAARQLLGAPAAALVGQPVAAWLDPGSRAAVAQLLDTTRATGRPAEIRARVAHSLALIELTATPVRGDGTLLMLVRARAVDPTRDSAEHDNRLAHLVERTPDAVVVTDASGRVLMANPAFVQLCQLANEAQVRGQPLGDWLHPEQVQALLTTVRRDGIAPQVRSAMTPAGGRVLGVDVSATLLADGDQECAGFTIRHLDADEALEMDALAELASAIRHLDAQVGHVRLETLLAEAALAAERHILKMTLARAAGDVGSAAVMLGIDLPQLMLKLDRLGLSHDAGLAHGTPPPLLN